MARWATAWEAICSSVRTASNWLTRSAEETISFADRAKEFNRAGVDHRDVHDGVVGGVLHGQAVVTCQDRCEAGGEFLPAGVDVLLTGQVVEPAGFDAMDELLRLTVGGDEVVPAPGDVGVGIDTQDASGDGVAVVVVVEEPAVEFGFGSGAKERFLNGFQLHDKEFTASDSGVETHDDGATPGGGWPFSSQASWNVRVVGCLGAFNRRLVPIWAPC